MIQALSPSIRAGKLPWIAQESSDSWQKNYIISVSFFPSCSGSHLINSGDFGMSDIWHIWLLELYNGSLWLAVTEPHLSVGRCLICTWLCWDWPCPGKTSPTFNNCSFEEVNFHFRTLHLCFFFFLNSWISPETSSPDPFIRDKRECV